ncbi:LapA family protein [Paenibacillus radicis (ex Xue et al. 2023)]|uniref:Lipopolysaccharide assembly protein LapA domain-containing protein n=1 Tax=Paenibacillus radicis (ex Xue et al. 2023) TaxID=2972489 RepID=A0ABT1YCZ1_9BACL|nr:lipopolysaccharide assembly protein LapA domain-containing protein [Paenibacillus radicis (ex Xue et al. 2023)]MCR8631075.1 lipopolysaccharide assembly protein LapA domain-containing protein [Paenibacillus radicis (ex Xue et al. 2023)]
MKAQWTFILILVFALITAIFAVFNVAPVRVHLIFTETELPLILIILGSTLLGGLIVGLIGVSRQFKLKKTIKQMEKQLVELKQASSPTATPAIVSEQPSPAPAEPETKQHVE